MAVLPKSLPLLSLLLAVNAGAQSTSARRPDAASRAEPDPVQTRSASAPAPAARLDAETPSPSERRDGFTAGVHLGPLAGKAVGYPNEVDKIDEPDHRASTRVGLGGMASAWVGGALRDWFSVGAGGAVFRVLGHGLQGDAFAVFFRVEAFPAYSAGRAWRDLSLFADFGAGSMWIMDGADTQAEGGAMSVVGIGAAHEAWRTGHVAAGPVIAYQHMFSASLESHVGLAGIRLAFYGGP